MDPVPVPPPSPAPSPLSRRSPLTGAAPSSEARWSPCSPPELPAVEDAGDLDAAPTSTVSPVVVTAPLLPGRPPALRFRPSARTSGARLKMTQILCSIFKTMFDLV
uniref:Uncharacterized protein n=1 Tax=Zea mays TaxID=4577 RepID=C0PPF2_MAIZE|nr:unknown [Zea mays]